MDENGLSCLQDLGNRGRQKLCGNGKQTKVRLSK